MALDSDRTWSAGSRLQGLWQSLWERVQRAAEWSVEEVRTRGGKLAGRLGLDEAELPEPLARWTRKLGNDGPWRNAIIAWFNRQPLVRFISRSLLRRILASNLAGLGFICLGIVYLSFDSSWIINAKREALKTQGQIIAAAIAGSAMVEEQGEIFVDPDRLPASKDALIPFRDDGFASLQLSIRPEQVAPILRRLTEPTKTRARIYDRRGDLVIDSNDLLRAGDIVAHSKSPKGEEERPNTKNFWTRLQHLLIGKEVQVYREIGSANGQLVPEVRHALEGHDAALLFLNRKGEQIVSVAVPVKRINQVIGVLLLSTRPGDIDEVLAETRNDIIPYILIAFVAAISTAIILNRTVVGPMKRLSLSAEHVNRDITARTALPDYADRKDEVGQMARAFSAMTKSLYQRLEGSEKFAADVAHELKNPLTAASSIAQSLEYARTEEDRAELVQQMQQELKRLNRLISDVSRASMLNAQLQRETPEPVQVDAVLKDVVSIFEEKIAGGDTRIGCKLKGRPDRFLVAGNAGRIGQVFTNLIDNALSFSPENGTVAVTGRVEDGHVVISIEDEGPGIEPDKLETIFTRFYTYRPTGQSSRGTNSGLGLSISKEIIESHKGRIWAENRSFDGADADGNNRTGSRFIVSLPVLESPEPRQSTARKPRA